MTVIPLIPGQVLAGNGGDALQLCHDMRSWTDTLSQAEAAEPWLILGGAQSLETLTEAEQAGRRVLAIHRGHLFPDADIAFYLDYEPWLLGITQGWVPKHKVVMHSYPLWETGRSKSLPELMQCDMLLRRVHTEQRLFFYGLPYNCRQVFRRDKQHGLALLDSQIECLRDVFRETDPSGTMAVSLLAHCGVRDIAMVGFFGDRAAHSDVELPPEIKRMREVQADRDRDTIRRLKQRFPDLHVSIR